MPTPAHRRRAARHHHPTDADADVGEKRRRGPSGGRKTPITVDAIVDAALHIVEREGFTALTMRRVAGALRTGPASLYAHVVNKEDLDDLLIGRLCTDIALPEPNSHTWRAQMIDVCRQVRDQYLRYPGISLAALTAVPTNVETLRVSEGMLGIAMAAGTDPQRAAWTIDALLLYVSAFCIEASLIDARVERDGWTLRRTELQDRLAALPDDFPHTKRHAAQVTSGTPAERFEFTVNTILDGLEYGRTR